MRKGSPIFRDTTGPSNKWKDGSGKVDYETVLKENDKLIHFVLAKFRIKQSNPLYEDIYSTCQVRLCRAAELWDPSIAKWSTYAYNTIWRAIGTELKADRQESATSLNDIIEFPSMKLPGERSGEVTPETREFITWCLDGMRPKESAAIRRHYLEGYTLEEIAKQDGCTRERVRQIILFGMKRIRLELLRHQFDVPDPDIHRVHTPRMSKAKRRPIMQTPEIRAAIDEYQRTKLAYYDLANCEMDDCRRSNTAEYAAQVNELERAFRTAETHLTELGAKPDDGEVENETVETVRVEPTGEFTYYKYDELPRTTEGVTCCPVCNMPIAAIQGIYTHTRIAHGLHIKIIGSPKKPRQPRRQAEPRPTIDSTITTPVQEPAVLVPTTAPIVPPIPQRDILGEQLSNYIQTMEALTSDEVRKHSNEIFVDGIKYALDLFRKIVNA